MNPERKGGSAAMHARKGSLPRRRAQAQASAPPLEVTLSVRLRTGDRADQVFDLLPECRMPMVGSVFAARDRLIAQSWRLFAGALVTQPRLLRLLMPGLRSTRR
jgi:hypothetical protein